MVEQARYLSTQNEIKRHVQNDYRVHAKDYLLWNPRDGQAHFGYWEFGISPFNREAMIDNMSWQVIEGLNLHKSQPVTVADLGCGAGGTARILAREYPNARVFGLSSVNEQLELGKKLTVAQGLTEQISLFEGDYFETPFSTESMHGVVGVEAWCYARDMADVFREAYRILKPGGRVSVADAFLRHSRPLNPITRKLYDVWHNQGWKAVLNPIDRLTEKMEEMGFDDIQVRDVSLRVIPTVAQGTLMAAGYLGRNLVRGDKDAIEYGRSNLVAALTTAAIGVCMQDVGYFLVGATKA